MTARSNSSFLEIDIFENGDRDFIWAAGFESNARLQRDHAAIASDLETETVHVDIACVETLSKPLRSDAGQIAELARKPDYGLAINAQGRAGQSYNLLQHAFDQRDRDGGSLECLLCARMARLES